MYDELLEVFSPRNPNNSIKDNGSANFSSTTICKRILSSKHIDQLALTITFCGLIPGCISNVSNNIRSELWEIPSDPNKKIILSQTDKNHLPAMTKIGVE